MLLPIHRWLPHSHEIAAPVQGLLERTKTQLFSIAPLCFIHTSQINAASVLNKRRICDVT